MIVKQTRASAAHVSGLVRHITAGPENEAIETLAGDPHDIAAVAEARQLVKGGKNALRQVIFAPSEPLSAAQERRLVEAWRSEFSAESYEYALVKHTKARADGNEAPHYHMLLPELDAAGKRLDDRFYKVRNEKLARSFELEFSHKLTKGRHNRAVHQQLANEGHTAAAEAVAPLTTGKPALSRFSAKAHAIAKRENVNLSAISHDLADAVGASSMQIAAALFSVMQKFPVSIGQGEKDLILQSEGGVFIASLNRNLKADKEQNGSIINELQRLIWQHGQQQARQDRHNNKSDSEHSLRSSSGEPERRKSGAGDTAAASAAHGADHSAKQSDAHNERSNRSADSSRELSVSDYSRLVSASAALLSSMRSGAAWSLYGQQIKQIDYAAAKRFPTIPAAEKSARAPRAAGAGPARQRGEVSGIRQHRAAIDVTKDGLAALNAANDSLPTPGG